MTAQRFTDVNAPDTLGTNEASAAAHTRQREDLIHPDPLLDCLVEVCRLHGHAASRASLSAGLPLPANTTGAPGCMNLDLVERAVARAGMTSKLQRSSLHDIDAAALPAVLILRDNLACVLVGTKRAKTPSCCCPKPAKAR
jgi:ATP-binding cassette, subfamily C, bacterial LapB